MSCCGYMYKYKRGGFWCTKDFHEARIKKPVSTTKSEIQIRTETYSFVNTIS